jgi:hypothetical protein
LLSKSDCAWWYTSVIPALERQRREDHEFKASLGYTEGDPISKKRSSDFSFVISENYK